MAWQPTENRCGKCGGPGRKDEVARVVECRGTCEAAARHLPNNTWLLKPPGFPGWLTLQEWMMRGGFGGV